MRYFCVFASFILASATLVRADIASALAGLKSSDPGKVQRSVGELRQAGPDGLSAILRLYDAHPDPALAADIDAVAGQRGAVWSRLYWYTDLKSAEAAAQAQRKPILYLRLMGKLTDEYSCANSRFFRTVLYSNANVSNMLREQFVLVWVSERPVPVVTIDYGDGRTLKRTLTGNSIHYVLTPTGEVVDALPGLFDPVSFGQIVGYAGYAAMDGPEFVAKHIARAKDDILRQWDDDTSRVNPALVAVDPGVRAAVKHFQAVAAMRMTVSKMAVEAPLLAKISPQFANALDQSIYSANEDAFRQIAPLHAANAMLDEQSIAIIRSQNPSLDKDPKALARTVAQFQQTIAEDSVRDNYVMRRQVLTWLGESNEAISLNDLNERVYSELFQTPRSDPWLGLMPPATYTALTNDGCCPSRPQ